MAVKESPVIADATLDALDEDPYPFYARWRRESPVAYHPVLGSWLISRWEDCELIGQSEERMDTFNDANIAYMGPNIINLSGDPHRRLRAAVDAPLRPKAVRAFVEGRGREVAREYVRRIRERGACDATTELTELISVRVIGEMLGVGDKDDATLQRWFKDLQLGSADFGRDPQVAVNADTAKSEIEEYCGGVFERLGRTPDDSMMSHLLHTEAASGPRTFEELAGTIYTIIIGAFQEPGHVAGTALYGLLTEPEQLQAVVGDDSLVPAAIHEGLRWIAPFGQTERRTLVDFAVGDYLIPAGGQITLLIASANRDEKRFDHPDRFDITRERSSLASFGYGAHFCSGHFIGRELARVILEETFRGLPNLHLDDEREVDVHGFFARGVRRLPVVWDSA